MRYGNIRGEERAGLDNRSGPLPTCTLKLDDRNHCGIEVQLIQS